MSTSSAVHEPPAGGTAAAWSPDHVALLRDQVRGTFDFNRTSLLGHLIGAVIIELMFFRVAPPVRWIGWGAVFAVVWLVRVALAVRFARNEPQTAVGLRRRLRVWQCGAIASAFLWGTAAWIFYPYGDSSQQLSLVLVVYTFSVASVPVLAPQYRLFTLFVLLVFVPAVVAVAVHSDAHGGQSAVVMTVAMAMIMVLGRNYRDQFDGVIALKLRTEALAEQLRAEKLDADAARHQAEVANRAKTQFFTAASHDLRQPLHAMGLFAEALRSRTHEPEVARLVNSINESVDALEGLFSELLDITRIDSGGVEVKPVHFEVAEIFRKLRLHYEPAAFEKGIDLRFRGAGRVLFADPLLVERILRNLVSNAIRYTEDGSVLVSCRRRGERLLLQVWDTGAGIGEDERSRIFEEFYQVAGARVSADQKKGLGLGLAIVRRLAALMATPVGLRSRVGHGSVFSIELPAGVAPRAGVQPLPGRAPVSLTLAGQQIVIVEDEPAVRQGLEVLLHAWGASTLSFDSVAAARAWAASAPPATATPALVIADYRLEHGETGVAAIRALRARFGTSVPAIVATGSNLTGQEQEAAEDDFHVLIKPVLPNKLRAMIAFKLADRQR